MVEAMKKALKLLIDFIDHIHTMKLIIEEKQKKPQKLLFHVQLEYFKIICMIKKIN